MEPVVSISWRGQGPPTLERSDVADDPNMLVVLVLGELRVIRVFK